MKGILLNLLCVIGAALGVSDWWETSAFYQIYPRSFKDSNGDGIGDLRGVIEKLPYLKELGINATWLSPIFKSPMADFGYDISSFYEIQPEYGTMKDFEDMIARAKELGIRIILDFVPNHSSDENEWFVKSENREAGFEDFYVWHDGYPDPENSSRRLPPNNWLSAFRGSAWEWNNKRQQFYYHNFVKKQPDLNYRNPLVVAEMKRVLWFWLNKGVAGFRCDATPALFEVVPDATERYPDEPVSGLTNDTDDFTYLKHIYVLDQPETLDMIYQWRSLMNTYKELYGGETRILMTEAYSPIDILMQYYGDGKYRDGSHIPFNFRLITDMPNYSTGDDLKKAIDVWMDNIPKGRTPNWVIGNHDQRRVASRLGTLRREGIAMIELTLPGASVTYNGDEIGMTDVYISWDDTVDPAACNSNPEIYEKFTRDPARTPFQWNNSTSAGFSTNPKTWLPISDNYQEINVEAETAAPNSYLKIYKSLLKLRQNHVLQHGSYESVVYNQNVIVVKREHEGLGTILTVVNWGGSYESLKLAEMIKRAPEDMTFVIVGIFSQYKQGETIRTEEISLQPYESFVLSK